MQIEDKIAYNSPNASHILEWVDVVYKRADSITQPPQHYSRHAHPFHYIDKVAEFHNKFKVPLGNSELRMALIHEEVNELSNALTCKSMHSIVDGLCDVIYVVAGTQLALNYAQTLDYWIPKITIDNLLIQLVEHSKAVEPNTMYAGDLARIIRCCHEIADHYGIHLWHNFLLVHNNNMSKTWTAEQVNALPEDCTYLREQLSENEWIIKSPAGKVLKPPGHQAPELVL